MSLSNESMSKLVDNIASDVFHLIASDPYYTETFMNLLPGAITEVIGDTSPELIGELGGRIMDRVGVDGCDVNSDKVWEERYRSLFRYVKNTYASEYVDGAEYGQMGTMYGDFTSTSELD
ncbi:hypothetical protein Syn7803C16_73 [Synechococcus phage ACG-2014f]|uniref:Uncharacterized protein n=2 Tax=Atlauavirus tusconc8 TaxID=2734085 RepID=A0A0E3I2S5_9CAUD|nr:hypothetical protein Syn7803C16_73 [Synechococcus phage ACG-2014f]AIX43712.1 hypothetical protein Syn7803C24_73 [Synechococcus phage ACG-2014f]